MSTEIAGVRVITRLRPLNTKELSNGQTVGWQYNKTTILEQLGGGTKSYKYDSVLGPDSTNDQAYDDIALNLVKLSLNGYNTTVFAYGQTGSGKTWTMMGDDHGRCPGIIPRALEDLFAHIKQDKDRDYLLRCSFLELYNESINDLLNTEGTGKNLTIIADDPTKGAVIGGLTEQIIQSVEDGMSCIELGNDSRQVASTAMNARSSRSHTIFRIVLEATKTEEALERERQLLAAHAETDGVEEDDDTFKSFGKKKEKSNTVISYLNLVDLAGSERQGHTQAEGKQLKEGAAINKSLLALGAVINKLSGGLDEADHGGAKGHHPKNRRSSAGSARTKLLLKRQKSAGNMRTKKSAEHIPYRNSKLTRILRQSLGGNTYTSIIIAMSPAPMYKEESRSSLKFGQMCKKIQNKAKKNNVADDKSLLKQYKLQIAQLKQQLENDKLEMEKQIQHKPSAPTSSNIPSNTQQPIESSKENKELRNKLKMLQTMFLGGSTPQPPTNAEIEAAKTGSNKWAKLRMGVKLGGSAGLAAGLKRAKSPNRRKRRSSHVVQQGSSMGKMMSGLMNGMAVLEDVLDEDDQHTKGQIDLDDAYRKARYLRQEKELTKFKDQKQLIVVQLQDVRNELEEEKAQHWEQKEKMVEVEEKIQKYKKYELEVLELQSLYDRSNVEMKELTTLHEETKRQHQIYQEEMTQKQDSVTLNLASEEERSAALQVSLTKVESHLTDVLCQLKAGRNAMQTMQSKILGKSGQRLAIMAVDLEKTVADFQNKQTHLQELEIELNRKQIELEQTKDDFNDRSIQMNEHEKEYKIRLDKLIAKEKKFNNWKQYADIQEAAFNRRDADIDKIGQEQEMRAHEMEVIENEVHNREENVTQEEAKLSSDREELRQMGKHIRDQQHDVETRALRMSASTRVQGMVRIVLRAKAAKSVLLSNERARKLDEREKKLATREAQNQADRQKINKLSTKASLQETTNERTMKRLNQSEVSLQRRTDQVMAGEKRQRVLQQEIEHRHVDAIAREAEIGEIRSNLFEKEMEVEEREKGIEAERLIVHSRDESIEEREKNMEAEDFRLNMERDHLHTQRMEVELSSSNVDLRTTTIEKQENINRKETKRNREEWEEAHAAKLEHESQIRILKEAEEECHHMKTAFRARENILKDQELILSKREKELQQLVPREKEVENREILQTKKEHDFYESTAAKVHSRQAEQIRTLENCLTQEVKANHTLQKHVQKMRESISREEREHKEDTKQHGTNESNESNRIETDEKNDISNGFDNDSFDFENEIEIEKDIVKDTESEDELKEKGLEESKQFKALPASPGVGRLHRARSMIRHMIQDQDIKVQDQGKEQQHSATSLVMKRMHSNNLMLPSPPRASKQHVNVLDARAKKRFRNALGLLERTAREIVVGGRVMGVNPTKAMALPWNTWFRVVGGGQEEGLSLQLFRYLIRRRAKVTNSAVSDQDLRRVFECIDCNKKGYIKMMQFLNWLKKKQSGKGNNVEDDIVQMDVTKREIIDVTVTL